jgi:hypothetical protein
VNGGGTKPGEAYFSLDQDSGGTLFVTAVPKDGRYAVRMEIVIEP